LKNDFEVYGESKQSILYSNYTTGWRVLGSVHSRGKGFTLFICVYTVFGPTHHHQMPGLRMIDAKSLLPLLYHFGGYREIFALILYESFWTNFSFLVTKLTELSTRRNKGNI